MRELEADLQLRRRQGLYRERRIVDSAQGVETRVDGRSVLSFCSNDYLGLAAHPEIAEAFIDGVRRYGVGSGAAHLVNGHGQLHEACEQRLARHTGRDRALLFSTGYMANLAVASALLGRGDEIYQDRLNHASLIDSARLSDARLKRYRHGDLEQLDAMLSRDRAGARRLIMTDAVFSMDGDCADVVGLAAIAEAREAWLMVDDAHGYGVLGANGGGLLEQAGLGQRQVPVLMATLGKAVGVAGAFIAGSETLIETLIQRARPYIYTTAAPPALAAATLCALDIIEREAWRRQRLADNIGYFRQCAASLDWSLLDSSTAIQPLIVGDNERALRLSRDLFDAGIHVTAIRPPTVAAGSARLRVTLCAMHERRHIDRLVDTLRRL